MVLMTTKETPGGGPLGPEPGEEVIYLWTIYVNLSLFRNKNELRDSAPAQYLKFILS